MIKVVGLGQNFWDLPPSYEKIIKGADVLIGGKRQLEPFACVQCEKIPIVPPIEKVISLMEKYRDREVVVLADGDPLFFGIGQRLIREFGRDFVCVYPNVSVVQRAGAKLGVSTKDIFVVSLHGRDNLFELLSAISWHRFVGVYTDRFFTPSKLAQIFLQRQIYEFTFHVFEDLTAPGEKVRHLSVEEAAKMDFSPLNFLILERSKEKEIDPYPGMDDGLFFKDKNQITKKEVRVISLSQMKLYDDSIVWDIGAGSGSVSIESLVLAKKGRVYAIEKDPNRANMIKENRKRFGLHAIEVIEDLAQNVVLSLPSPDRIFIGGGLLNSPELLGLCYGRLKPGGRMVINTVLYETLDRCVKFCEENKIKFDVIYVNVSRSESLSTTFRFVPVNPVMVITIFKPNTGLSF